MVKNLHREDGDKIIFTTETQRSQRKTVFIGPEGQKDQCSVISVPLTSASEWMVKNL